MDGLGTPWDEGAARSTRGARPAQHTCFKMAIPALCAAERSPVRRA